MTDFYDELTKKLCSELGYIHYATNRDLGISADDMKKHYPLQGERYESMYQGEKKQREMGGV